MRVVRVSLPPIGPASPFTPPPNRWYLAMQTLNCGQVAADPGNTPQGQRALFESLAQLCLTLTGQGGAVDWAAAASALQQTAGETNCFVLGARAMLSAAVAAHQSDPTAVIAGGDTAPGTACPVRVTEVTGVDQGTTYTLEITGEYLYQATGVTVGSEALTAIEGSEGPVADPPVGTVSAIGSGCLQAGVAVNVVVSGAGYQASR